MKAPFFPPWDTHKAVVVYRDRRYTLGQKNDRPYLIANSKRFTLTCHPYEPCLYIIDEYGCKTAVHYAFDPFDVLDAFSRGEKKYKVQPEYDYIDNSVYKTFLACDPVSDEILLHYHYRCHRKIIEFNNKKYYNGKLSVESNVESNTPLVFVDVKESGADIKNTAPEEAEQILQYVQKHPEQNVGIITPFTNQRELIESGLKKIGRKDVTCGTVHAFQGDEKDVILFSLGLSKITGVKTYDFLFPGNCIFPSVMLYCKYADANCKGVTESDENAALSVRLLFVIYGRGRRAAVLPCRSGRGDPVFVAGT